MSSVFVLNITKKVDSLFSKLKLLILLIAKTGSYKR